MGTFPNAACPHITAVGEDGAAEASAVLSSEW